MKFRRDRGSNRDKRARRGAWEQGETTTRLWEAWGVAEQRGYGGAGEVCAAELRECDGLRVWGSGGGAGGWEGAQRIGGGLKEAGRGSRRGSKEGNPGDLGGIQARALRCGGEEAGRRARAAARGEGRWLAGVWA